MKYFIISQPKSGTYLAANLLVEFGIGFDGLHYSKKTYQKYDLTNLAAARLFRRKYTYKQPIAESIKLIKENYLGVGHLEYDCNLDNLLKDFKKILLLRDIKSSEESWKNWASLVNKSHKTKLLDVRFRSNIQKWNQSQNIFVLQFYDIKNKNLAKIDDLQTFLFGKKIIESSLAIDRALNKDSLTKIIGK